MEGMIGALPAKVLGKWKEMVVLRNVVKGSAPQPPSLDIINIAPT